MPESPDACARGLKPKLVWLCGGTPIMIGEKAADMILAAA